MFYKKRVAIKNRHPSQLWNQFHRSKLDQRFRTVLPILWREAGGVSDDNPEMGADLLSGVGCRRHPRLHRPVGRIGGYRPLPVLRLRRDLLGPADSWADDFRV
jgi:hypothetical protein